MTRASMQPFGFPRQSFWGVAGLLAIIGLTIGSGFLLGMRVVERHLIVIAILWTLAAFFLGAALRTSADTWLAPLMTLAMAAKLVSSWFRYFILVVFYGGSGDAPRYHRYGTEIADTWRALEIPDITTVAFGSEGTRFTAWITGLVYTPFQPSLLGGFWMFALSAFIGQVFLYLAFRRVVDSHRWRRFAILIFFWPTLLYWPSSIGKEALIMLFLGVGSWAAANMYRKYQFRWLPLIAGSAFLMSMVRVHVAAIFVGSLFLAALLSKQRGSPTAAFRRIGVLLIGLVALLPLALEVGDEFGVDSASLSADDIDPVFADVGEATEQGGSAVSGGVIRSPADIPAAILKVLFRPLPIEARNAPMLVSSLEGTLLLGLILWQLPKMIKNRRLLRRSPYLLFCFVYSSLFIWAWSAILNLGIIARQRSLVIPFVLALVAALGWVVEDPEPERHSPGEYAKQRPHIPESAERMGHRSRPVVSAEPPA